MNEHETPKEKGWKGCPFCLRPIKTVGSYDDDKD